MKGGTSSAHNDKPNDKPESPTTGNTNAHPPKCPKKKKKSEVWDHFSTMGDCDPNYLRASCNYCGKDYGCHGKRDGTSNLWNKLYNQCPTHFKSNEYA